MIVDTHIDESGTHGSSPHLIMGGIVGRLGQWADFDKLWRRMLRQEDIEYYHTKSMKNGIGPFKGWRPERKSALVNRIGKIKENGAPPKRFVIIAFESVDKAKAWDATPAQQEVNALAEKSLKSRRFIVEGM